MKQVIDFISKEPIAVSEAVRSVVIMLVVFNVAPMSEPQFGALMVAVGAVLALFARGASTPNTKLPGPSA